MLHIHESCNIEPTKGGVEKLLQIYVLSLDMELVDIEPTLYSVGLPSYHKVIRLNYKLDEIPIYNLGFILCDN